MTERFGLQKKAIFQNLERIIKMSIYEKINPALYAEKAYLDYTMDVVSNRAIPSLKDGQKPVQRRILFAMKELGLYSGKEPKKSARIVGDIIGKYHPHGDGAAYEAMVKMSQDFYLRYPLIDGQGNFGSRDGDSAAAMRYTEAKLSPISELLLSEIGEGSCDFIDNYDQLLQEPAILPSRLNFMLMNGTFGIAVALSTKIPSHNIRNVTDATIHQIKNPNCSVKELVEYLVAPDFPTGGQIIDSKDDIVGNYERGEGTFNVRCKYKVEKLDKGQWQIVIYELPPSSSPTSLMDRIGNIEKPKLVKDKNGKVKKPSIKQIADKQILLNYVSDYRDDSSGEEGIRVVLEPRSSRVNPEEMMASLFKLLELEETFKMNLVAIGGNDRATNKNLKDMISEWVDFRFYTLNKRTEYGLKKALKRIHILEGRKIAFDYIDRIIEIIKGMDNPKEKLMEEFNLSEEQALDILEIKLRQLAKMEIDSIIKELDKLYKERNYLSQLLESKVKMKNLMIKELESDTKKYEDERRTLVKEDEKSGIISSDVIIDEKVTIIMTKQGWLTSRKGHDLETDSVQLKDGDDIFKIMEGRTSQQIVLMASNGRTFNIKPSNIVGGKNMNHVNTLIDLPDGVIVDILFLGEKDKYLVSNNAGYGFIVEASNLLTKNKAGKVFFNVPKDAHIFPLLEIGDKKLITCFTSDFRILSYDLNEIKELPKGKGVQLVKLPSGVKMDKYLLHNEREIIVETENKVCEFNIDDGSYGKRALRGINFKSNILALKEKV
jgi:topoisomerase IV subunit A